jgi:hypothetical protein
MNDQPDAENSTCKHTVPKRDTNMPPVEFEPAIPASERPQTHALDRAVTGIRRFKLSKGKGHPITGNQGPRGGVEV